MYIWILLATIMIALSFFNLSPRADKEGVFTEVKAESLVSRFRTEHAAFSRVAECKLIRESASAPIVSKFAPTEGSIDEYIWENRSLPIGYTRGSDLNVYHYTFCLRSDVTKGDSPLMPISNDCTNTPVAQAYRYSVSFAPLTTRWRSKIDSGDVIPVLNKALSRQYVKGSVLGLVNCSGDDTKAENCSFHGSPTYEKANEAGITRLSFEPGAGDDFYNVLFANEDFAGKCSGNICFFAIHKLSNRDVDKHCEKLYEEYSDEMSAAAGS